MIPNTILAIAKTYFTISWRAKTQQDPHHQINIQTQGMKLSVYLLSVYYLFF